MIGSPRVEQCSKRYEQSLIPFFYVSRSSRVVSFPQFAPWIKLWLIYHFPQVVLAKNELEKSLKKLIWPPGSMKWLGILTDDVFQHTRQFSNSFQSADIWIIFILAQPMRKSPQGRPLYLATDVFHCYIMYYEVVKGPRVN